jgi:hypothetical protein
MVQVRSLVQAQLEAGHNVRTGCLTSDASDAVGDEGLWCEF